MVTNAYFEKVTKFAESDIPMPIRKTENSAGYDFVVAEDVVLTPYATLMEDLQAAAESRLYTLEEISALTK